MQWKMWLAASAALLAVAMLLNPALSQDDAGKPAPASAQEKKKGSEETGYGITPVAQNEAELMQVMMKYARPTRYHERLEAFVGDWDATTKMWWTGDESTDPLTSTGKVSFEWLMPNRWLQGRIDASMAGMPYQGFMLLGYDNYKRKYVTTWVDTMGTAMIQSSGGIDPSGTIIDMYGTMDEPTTGEIGKHARLVYRIVDEDHLILEVHDLAIVGRGTKVMQVEYTRKKD